jgi:hypothetical protein
MHQQILSLFKVILEVEDPELKMQFIKESNVIHSIVSMASD